MDQKEKHEWLMNEYKCLSDHYFHEDNYLLKTNTLFIAFNAGLLAFLSRKFGSELTAISNGTLLIFAIIGLVSACSWGLSILRTHVYRTKIEERIEKFENEYKDILGIRTKRGKLPFYVTIPSSIIMLILPSVFLLVWLYQIFEILVF